MSLRYEQYHALRQTRRFLFDLLDARKRPKTVRALKARASACLCHFPSFGDSGEPLFSHDSFPDEHPNDFPAWSDE